MRKASLSLRRALKFDALIDICYSCLNGIQTVIEQSQFPDYIVSDEDQILPHSLSRLNSPLSSTLMQNAGTSGAPAL